MATYKESGVDIDTAEKMVSSIKEMVASTANKHVLKKIGLFGGFFEVPKGYKKPVLVSSVDGVGTKLKVAFAMNKHDTIGQCLVNHCVNDILCCGAEPLFFMDYFATGKLSAETGVEIIKGFVKACKENGCALIGGETAEMPGFYSDNEYDVSGTIVGIVDKKNIIDGSKIKCQDVLIGIASNGLHTNGYSLARKVLFSKYKANDHIAEIDNILGEELLKIHKSYLHPVRKLMKNKLVTGLSHITGGGLVGNTMRIIPKGFKLNINWNSWDEPVIFDVIRRIGNVPEEDMRRTFNLGIGMVVIVRKINVNKVISTLKRSGEQTFIIGEVIKE